MPELDKFYTQKNVAAECLNLLYSCYPNVDFSHKIFLEPSAGEGAFSSQLQHCLALDLKPEGEGILTKNFLEFDVDFSNFITIGNPPFGHRSKLAIDFFNKAAKYSDVIAFIVPVSFCKWNVQKELNSNFSLVQFHYLKPESFTANGIPYSVRTVFQIWAKKNTEFDLNDLRLKKSPPISHNDFKIWQHNATEQSRSTVLEPWEIATWRQGFKDFNSTFTRDDFEWLKQQVYTTNQQFFFIQPLNDKARKIISKMDFNQLAARNTATPGFGKGDFVNYYMELEQYE